jgi:hypothetical protein
LPVERERSSGGVLLLETAEGTDRLCELKKGKSILFPVVLDWGSFLDALASSKKNIIWTRLSGSGLKVVCFSLIIETGKPEFRG